MEGNSKPQRSDQRREEQAAPGLQLAPGLDSGVKTFAFCAKRSPSQAALDSLVKLLQQNEWCLSELPQGLRFQEDDGR